MREASRLRRDLEKEFDLGLRALVSGLDACVKRAPKRG